MKIYFAGTPGQVERERMVETHNQKIIKFLGYPKQPICSS